MPYPKLLQLEYIAFYLCVRERSLLPAESYIYVAHTAYASCRNEKKISRGERHRVRSLYLLQTNPLFYLLQEATETENSSFVPTVFRQGDKGCNWFAVLAGTLDVRIKQETTKVSWNFFLINSLFVSCSPTKPFCLANFYLLFCPLLFVKKRNFIVSSCGKGKLKPRRHFLIILACRLDATRPRKFPYCVCDSLWVYFKHFVGESWVGSDAF
jgi:hypothetical protein